MVINPGACVALGGFTACDEENAMIASVPAAPPEKKWRRVKVAGGGEAGCTECGGSDPERGDGTVQAIGRPNGETVALCPACKERLAVARGYVIHGPHSSAVPCCPDCKSATNAGNRTVGKFFLSGGRYFFHCSPWQSCPNARTVRTSNVGRWLGACGIAALVALICYGGWLAQH